MWFLAVVGALVLASASQEPAVQSPVRPLPDNKPCPYPEAAGKAFVAGPVAFGVDVRPDGTVASVDVRKIPKRELGFEETVRECLSKWRFEAAPGGETALRRHEGRIAFRLIPAKEAAIRGLLEALATSWSVGDPKAVEELSLQADDAPGTQPPEGYLRRQIQGQRLDAWRMELDPEVDSIEFLGPELATVRQGYRSVPAGDANSRPAEGDRATLEAMVAAGTRGWRLLSVDPVATLGTGIVRVDSGRIREPRKTKDVPPRYPDAAKMSRTQGVVVLECLISPDGKVRFVRVLQQASPVLGAAAVEAVRQWEYTPTFLDGRPVPIFMRVTVNFRLS